MANWDVTSAIANLRSLLGDGASDKFEFKAAVYPTPDSVTTRFFVGQTRLVSGTLEVYKQGVQIAPSGVTDTDTAKGAFTISPAPKQELLASFYYQWFTDAELLAYLNDAAGLIVGVESVSGDYAIGLRPVVSQFAAHLAYMRKAAEFAEAVEASAAGYQFKRDQASPNWKGLADAAFKTGQEKLKLYVENPLGSTAPAMAFVAFRLDPYQGR